MDAEKLLEKCGDFGRYQYLLIALFCVVNIICAMDYYSQTIISFTPEHWCDSAELANKTYDEIRKIYLEYSNPSCSVLNNELRSSNTKDIVCEKWIYNLDYGYQSMTSEFNWICYNAWQSTIGQSMFFVGSVIGTTIFGYLSDRLGRLPILISAHIMAGVGNGATIFAYDATTFAMCRFISGMATDSNFTLMYIIVMEYIRPSKRTFGLNLSIGCFYCIGSIITPWIAVGLGNWRLFLLTAAITTMIVPFYYFVMPESALWLISKNRIDVAIDCLNRVATFNGKHLTVNDIAEFRKNAVTAADNRMESDATFLDLFKTPRLRRNMFVLLFTSMVITLCYDAISRNVEGLGISPFIMFSISAAAIFPACLTLLLLQDKIGRKAMSSSSLLISGIFISATGIIIIYNGGVQNVALMIILTTIGRFGVVVAYNACAQYTTELIPTCVRGQGVAVVHVCGYAFTFFSAYILFLGTIFKPLPSLILGILSLIGAGLVLLLPETLHRIIPTTIKDGEEFGMIEKTKF